MGDRAVRLYGQRLSAGVRALTAVRHGFSVPSGLSTTCLSEAVTFDADQGDMKATQQVAMQVGIRIYAMGQ